MKTTSLLNAIKAHLDCKNHMLKKQLINVAVEDETTTEQPFDSCRVSFGSEEKIYTNSNEQQLLERFELPSRFQLEKTEKPAGNSTPLSSIFSSITTYSEEKELALLFLDIRNFTNIMEANPAPTVLHIIRILFILFSKSIKENGGRIIETGGDSLYAVFGMNGHLEDAVRASVAASHSILYDLDNFNGTYTIPHFGLNLEVGIGLHKGNVVMSYSDLDDIGHLTVMGLPVNIAARLQAATREMNNNLLISDEAYSLLHNEPGSDAVYIQLKGISSPVAVRMLGNTYAETRYIA